MKQWGMNLIGFDPIVSAEDAEAVNVKKMELVDIWPLADYITVHTPLIPATKHLISAEIFAKCKKGVKIINVARGGIIDEAALYEALESGQCGGAALDVFVDEPPITDVTKKLIKHPKVIATPHIGATTTEAQIKVAVEVAEQFIALAGTSNLYTTYPGVVNRSVL
jgi:D-3-phosphoglycerate dehydrogenase